MIDRKNGKDIYHNAIVYTYPGGNVDIICSSEPIFREAGWERSFAEDARIAQLGLSAAKPTPREAGAKAEGADMERSMRRARAKLRRLALANQFEYFVTLTLDGAKVNRYDGAAVVRKINQWCDNMVRRHGLRYILVPERHQDGAFHFHGFMAGPGLKAVDSGHDIGGRTAYNLPQWRLGFTTAQPLYGDYAAAVAYCCKYIGKQAGERPLGRWYYSGGALKEPAKLYTDIDFYEVGNDEDKAVEFSIPGAKMRVLHTKGEQQNDD